MAVPAASVGVYVPAACAGAYGGVSMGRPSRPAVKFWGAAMGRGVHAWADLDWWMGI